MGLSLTEKRRRVSAILPGLWQRLAHCDLCPRRCGADRLAGEKGFCGLSGERAPVSSYCLHRGEEPVISGTDGSGTIFFAHCNLGCVFCQNHQISDNSLDVADSLMSPAELAGIMRLLQAMGCHNINFVTPTHVLPHIVAALEIALAEGLTIPLVYNCGGYERAEIIRLLDGIMDIYLPDIKFLDPVLSRRFANAGDYPSMVTTAVKEMYRQTGETLEIDGGAGTAVRGLIIRHLVLPGCVDNSLAVLDFIAEALSPAIHLSLMSQYHPSAGSRRHGPPLNRTLDPAEYALVTRRAEALGMENGWFQEMESHRNYRPDFRRKHPFEKEG
jgi:putative pyruvate formate lyase activating enzyme